MGSPLSSMRMKKTTPTLPVGWIVPYKIEHTVPVGPQDSSHWNGPQKLHTDVCYSFLPNCLSGNNQGFPHEMSGLINWEWNVIKC